MNGWGIYWKMNEWCEEHPRLAVAGMLGAGLGAAYVLIEAVR